VYYTGTDTLKEGYALCYNFDATDVTAENLTLSQADSLVETPARRLQVEKPTINNSTHFAGVVSQKFTDFTGPGWIEINMPGSVCNIWAGANCDHEAAAGIQSGQTLAFTAGAYSFDYSGLPGAGSAVVLQDVDRSTTAGLVLAELCIGNPSGGVQTVVSTDMSIGQAVSTGGSVFPRTNIGLFGMTRFVTDDGDLTADVTYTQTGDGAYIGQTKVYTTKSLAAGADIVITVSQAVRVISDGISTGDTSFELDGADESLTLQWIGNGWQVFQTAS
jgi:hypothetical protein